jgi:thermosome
MDKMMVDPSGEIVVTNDGVTILREMQIEHPAAKMVVEVAKSQEEAVGDGTTTAVILAGELLKKAEDLLDQEIHPAVLTKGYRLAEAEAQRLLKLMGISVYIGDEQTLKNIAITAMTGKGAETNKEKLAEMMIQAVRQVAEMKKEGVMEKACINIEDIKVEKIVGDGAEESCLVRGIVLEKEIVHPEMPKKLEKAKVALLNSALEIRNTEIDAKIQITDPGQLNLFLEQEEKTLRQMAEKIKSSGANVLFCQKGIDDLTQHFLAKAGVAAVRRVSKSDMEKLARATSAKIVNNWKDLGENDLGSAGLVREEKSGNKEMVFVEKCGNPKAVTILVKGSTEHVVEEIKRAVVDALGDLNAALKEGYIVGGAGAAEMELAKGLKDHARSLGGREQLAVQAFAEAMEIVPRTLAENAGLDPIDVLVKLRSAHEAGRKWAGINVFNGEVMDAWKEGVIEPLKVKTQAVGSAAEVAEMILRIDDVILAGKAKEAKEKGIEEM